jgi:uncharacterized protein YfkK (UPF0435 family)
LEGLAEEIRDKAKSNKGLLSRLKLLEDTVNGLARRVDLADPVKKRNAFSSLEVEVNNFADECGNLYDDFRRSIKPAADPKAKAEATDQDEATDKDEATDAPRDNIALSGTLGVITRSALNDLPKSKSYSDADLIALLGKYAKAKGEDGIKELKGNGIRGYRYELKFMGKDLGGHRMLGKMGADGKIVFSACGSIK